MRISAAAAECAERIATMTRPLRPIKRIGLSLMHFQIAAAEHLFYGRWRRAHPVVGEPDSTGPVPDCDAKGIATARSAVVSHVELQGAVARAGNGERRRRVGDVLDAGLVVELRLAGRGRSRTSAA